MLYFIINYWMLLRNELITVNDFSFKAPDMDFRSAIAEMTSIRRDAFKHVSDPALIIIFLNHWELVANLMYALYEIIGRLRLSFMFPDVFMTYKFHQIKGNMWYDRKQKAYAFVGAVSRYGKANPRPSSYGELTRAMNRVMTDGIRAYSIPRRLPFGPASPG